MAAHMCFSAGPPTQRLRLFQRNSIILRASMKFKDYGDVGFQLDADNKGALEEMLGDSGFCDQLAAHAKIEDGLTVQFTGLLFEPVPWSPSTPKGMPKDIEPFYENSKYVIINVPPTFMFKAKIFKPARLCAVFESASKE